MGNNINAALAACRAAGEGSRNNEADLSRQLAECREKLDAERANYIDLRKIMYRDQGNLLSCREALDAATARAEAAEAELALALKERDTALDTLSASELAATAALANEQEKAARLVEALEWYAHDSRYDVGWDGDERGADPIQPEIFDDLGETARTALAAYRAGEGE